MKNTKYLQNGQKVVLVEELKTGGYLVKSNEDSHDPGDWEVGMPEHSFISTPFWVDAVFDNPFLDELEEKAKKLKEEIRDLEKGKSKLLREERAMLHKEKSEWSKTMEKIGVFRDKIEDLHLFVNNEITHCALITDRRGQPYKIEKWVDAKYMKNSKYQFRVLSLFGEKRGFHKNPFAVWRMHDYDEWGSGYCDVLFATSEQEAKEKLKEELERRAIHLKDYSDNFVNACKEYGVKLSGEKIDKYNSEKEADRLKKEKYRLDRIKRAKEELERLQA